MAINMPRFACSCKCWYNSTKHVLKNGSLIISQRHYGSALYVSNREMNKNFSYLTPKLDLDKRFEDIEKLQQEITLRGMDMDVYQMQKSWEFFKEMCSRKLVLEAKKDKLTEEIKKLKKQEETPEIQQESVKIRSQAKVLRGDLKVIKDVIADLEETTIVNLLKLPNVLDPNTPAETPLVLEEFGAITKLPTESVKSHVEIGKRLGLVEYFNPMLYYLFNEAALFEIGITNYLADVLDKNNLIRITGSDFSRSLVIEGSGLNHEDPMASFILENNEEIERNSPNRMHLVGGASLQAILAYCTKNLINPKHLPLQLFTIGREYTPVADKANTSGLFTACQAVVGRVFVATKDSHGEEHSAALEKLVGIVSKIYSELCEHYRVVLRSAPELRPWECSRISFELYSPYLDKYVEVGHISTYGNYISQRLLIAYQTSTGRDFPAIISGSILSVPKLLGCLLEENPEKFQVPYKVAEYMPMT